MLFQLPAHTTIIQMPAVEFPPYTNWEFWTAFGTVALAVITGVLARYTYLLFKAAREARKDSLSAIELSRISMERTLRPYVLLQRTEISGMEPNSIPTYNTVSIVNTGQSPAVDTRLTMEFGVETRLASGGSSYTNLRAVNEVAGIVGPADHRCFMAHFDANEKLRFQGEIVQKISVLRLKGIIDYLDPISSDRKSTYFDYQWTYGDDKYRPIAGDGNRLT